MDRTSSPNGSSAAEAGSGGGPILGNNGGGLGVAISDAIQSAKGALHSVMGPDSADISNLPDSIPTSNPKLAGIVEPPCRPLVPPPENDVADRGGILGSLKDAVESFKDGSQRVRTLAGLPAPPPRPAADY